MRVFFFLLLIGMWFTTGYSQKIDITRHGSSEYQIVLPQMPDVVEVEAAKVLQHYIQRISGATISLADVSSYNGRYGIWVGKAHRFKHGQFSEMDLSPDGYVIRTVDEELIIAGGEGKGVLYAVYSFLDKYLGCRKFSADRTYVPLNTSISVDEIDEIDNPAFSFREVYYNEVWVEDYMYWHKLN